MNGWTRQVRHQWARKALTLCLFSVMFVSVGTVHAGNVEAAAVEDPIDSAPIPDYSMIVEKHLEPIYPESDDARLIVVRERQGDVAEEYRQWLSAVPSKLLLEGQSSRYRERFPGLRVAGGLQTHELVDGSLITTEPYLIENFVFNTAEGYQGNQLVAGDLLELLDAPMDDAVFPAAASDRHATAAPFGDYAPSSSWLERGVVDVQERWRVSMRQAPDVKFSTSELSTPFFRVSRELYWNEASRALRVNFSLTNNNAMSPDSDPEAYGHSVNRARELLYFSIKESPPQYAGSTLLD